MTKTAYIIGGIFGYLVSLLGGIDEQLTALLILMCLDIFSGFLCAFLGRSSKSPSGYLSSTAAGAGIIKKVAYLICVIVGVLLERASGVQFIRQIIIISFTITESISILEKCRAMGITIPPVIYKALDIVRNKAAAAEQGTQAPGPDKADGSDPGGDK